MTQIATFKVGNEVFGIDVLLTKEIGRLPEVTKVPQSPGFILGLINLRGQIVTVIDPGVFLNEKSDISKGAKRLIILKNEDELEPLRVRGLIKKNHIGKDTLAIVVDQIQDIIDIEENSILPPPSNVSGTKKDLIQGIIQDNDHLIIVLAINEIARRCLNTTQSEKAI